MEDHHNQTVYQNNGYHNRKHYLEMLAEEYDPAHVYLLADLLGPNEDFDGLISHLEDAE